MSSGFPGPTAGETNASERALALLAALADLPTAPLHEQAVLRFVYSHLRALGLEPQADSYGNLVVHRPGGSAPPIALVAHTDHPAFEIVAMDGPGARAVLLGGVRIEWFQQPVPVRIFGQQPTRGVIVQAEVVEDPRRTVFRIDVEGPVAPGDFGVFDLPGLERDGSLMRMRAADDLVGCAAILLALERLGSRETPGLVYGVFTRAEEVSLVGASLVAEQRLLPPECIVVSLEASRALSGAAIGEGPVIRVGDATSSFHPEGEALLLTAARQLRTRQPAVMTQRQLMSGGTCEATAFSLAGYRTTGIALPLGNYHNMGPDNSIAPEYIHLDDFLGEIELLVAAIDSAGQPPAADVAARLAERAAQYRERLAATATLSSVLSDE